MSDQRNLILAIILSAVIMLGYELFFAKRVTPPVETPQSQSETTTAPPRAEAPPMPAPTAQAPSATAPSAPSVAATPSSLPRRDQVLPTTPRVQIASPRLVGSINLKGGRIDDLLLKDYRTTLASESPPVLLLSPQGTEEAYYAEFGWVGSDTELPTAETVWRADRDTLALNQPVTLTWQNSGGVTFSLVYSVDANFMFSVAQKVQNTSTAPLTVFPYGFITRRNTPPVTGYVVLHEGMLGVLDGTLKEITYKDLQKDGKVELPTTGGWLGFTDKYWLTALAPDQKTPVKGRFVHSLEGSVDKYQTDYLEGAIAVAPGGSAESMTRLFAGAKEVALLDNYADNLGIARFDLAIDFGWFYFLTKPIFYTLVYLHKIVGNFGIAILLLTVTIKLAFFPLANNSYKAMSRMRKLQPQILKLRERYAEDKIRLNQETMALYKREKVNPAAGCLPMVIQIPVFFALYKVLFVTIEMRHAPFFGWIKDLSVPDPSAHQLFEMLHITPPSFLSFLMIGIWPLIMGVTMWLQMKLNPQPVDPIQAKIFTFMPIIFTFMLAQFPAGLVIYWAWNNTLSISQQWVIMKRMGVR